MTDGRERESANNYCSPFNHVHSGPESPGQPTTSLTCPNFPWPEQLHLPAASTSGRFHLGCNSSKELTDTRICVEPNRKSARPLMIGVRGQARAASPAIDPALPFYGASAAMDNWRIDCWSWTDVPSARGQRMPWIGDAAARRSYCPAGRANRARQCAVASSSSRGHGWKVKEDVCVY